MKLSLTQITKNSLDNLKRIHPLIKDYIDEWVVVVPPKDESIGWLKDKATVIEEDFTQGIETKYIGQMKDWGLEVPKDYRLFNFAAARNASLKAATGDFVMWLDSDDNPLGMDNIKKFVDKYPESDVFNALYDYGKDAEGNSMSDHFRERVFRNNGKWAWKGASLGLIHETLLPIKPYDPLGTDFPEDVFRVEHLSDHMDESSMRNHIALLYEYLKTNGEDPRTTYYLGIEYFNRKMYAYCIKILLEFVDKTGSEEDKYMAYLKIAEAYQMLKSPNSSRNAYLTAIDVLPNRPDAYLGMGESYFQEENWAKAIDFIMTGLSKKLPKGKHGLDKMQYTFRPSGYVALAYLELGKPKDAYEWFVRAFKMNPKHPWVKQYAPLFADAKDLNDYVMSFVELGQLSQRLYPKTLSKLAEAVPDELMDQELLMDFKWRYTKPKVWNDKSVVFFCSAAFEDWGPESMLKGCGGSEEAVIQLSKELVKLGWEVTVYNNCIKEAVLDGVNWVRYERFNPKDIFNILISWRNNTFVDPKIALKKFIDMHDVPTQIEYYTEEQLEDVTLLVKSEYHRSLFKLPDNKSVVIPNGLDLKQFPESEKVKNSLVWTSSYDRGLEQLLEMWADVKKEVPNATLDVYYGFELYDSTPWGKRPEGQIWKRKMQELLTQDGITHYGRVGNDEIAKAYLKADIWAYPTNFPEISCITAMKAQVAKCRVLTSSFAALKETVIGDEEKLDMTNPEDVEKFKQKLIALLKQPRDEGELDGLAEIASQKYSWVEVAKQWDKTFQA